MLGLQATRLDYFMQLQKAVITATSCAEFAMPWCPHDSNQYDTPKWSRFQEIMKSYEVDPVWVFSGCTPNEALWSIDCQPALYQTQWSSTSFGFRSQRVKEQWALWPISSLGSPYPKWCTSWEFVTRIIQWLVLILIIHGANYIRLNIIDHTLPCFIAA